MNKTLLIGRLGQDPEKKQAANGNSVCVFSVATSKKYTDKNGERQEKTTWHNIVCFGKLADIASERLQKGKQVFIEGELQYDEYEGKKYTKIVCNEMNML